MKEPFKFSEEERFKLEGFIPSSIEYPGFVISKEDIISRIEKVIQSRNVADGGESGQSAEDVLKATYWYGETPFVDMYSKTTESIIQAMTTYAAQVSADKDREIEELKLLADGFSDKLTEYSSTILNLRGEVLMLTKMLDDVQSFFDNVAESAKDELTKTKKDE